MQSYAFYMQTYMQKYVKIRTVLAKHAEICTKYAQNMQLYAIKYAIICKNMLKCAFYTQKYMQKYAKIRTVLAKRVYVFAYGAYVCTPHFADAVMSRDRVTRPGL